MKLSSLFKRHEPPPIQPTIDPDNPLGPPLTTILKTLVIGEMLENMGHHAESIMEKIYPPRENTSRRCRVGKHPLCAQ